LEDEEKDNEDKDEGEEGDGDGDGAGERGDEAPANTADGGAAAPGAGPRAGAAESGAGEAVWFRLPASGKVLQGTVLAGVLGSDDDLTIDYTVGKKNKRATAKGTTAWLQASTDQPVLTWESELAYALQHPTAIGVCPTPYKARKRHVDVPDIARWCVHEPHTPPAPRPAPRRIYDIYNPVNSMRVHLTLYCGDLGEQRHVNALKAQGMLCNVVERMPPLHSEFKHGYTMAQRFHAPLLLSKLASRISNIKEKSPSIFSFEMDLERVAGLHWEMAHGHGAFLAYRFLSRRIGLQAGRAATEEQLVLLAEMLGPVTETPADIEQESATGTGFMEFLAKCCLESNLDRARCEYLSDAMSFYMLHTAEKSLNIDQFNAALNRSMLLFAKVGCCPGYTAAAINNHIANQILPPAVRDIADGRLLQPYRGIGALVKRGKAFMSPNESGMGLDTLQETANGVVKRDAPNSVEDMGRRWESQLLRDTVKSNCLRTLTKRHHEQVAHAPPRGAAPGAGDGEAGRLQARGQPNRRRRPLAAHQPPGSRARLDPHQATAVLQAPPAQRQEGRRGARCGQAQVPVQHEGPPRDGPAARSQEALRVHLPRRRRQGRDGAVHGLCGAQGRRRKRAPGAPAGTRQPWQTHRASGMKELVVAYSKETYGNHRPHDGARHNAVLEDPARQATRTRPGGHARGREIRSQKALRRGARAARSTLLLKYSCIFLAQE